MSRADRPHRPNGKGTLAVHDPAATLPIRWGLIKELTLERLFKRRLEALGAEVKKAGNGHA